MGDRQDSEFPKKDQRRDSGQDKCGRQGKSYGKMRISTLAVL